MTDRLLTDIEFAVATKRGLKEGSPTTGILEDQDAKSVKLERQAIGEWLEGTCEDIQEPRRLCPSCCANLMLALASGERPC